MPSTTPASAKFCTGTISPLAPACFAATAMGKAPRTGRTPPSSPSSPTMTYPSAVPPSCPVAARIPIAIGRSNAEPSFRTSAGARLMVMRFNGNSNAELAIAAPTRSRPSFTAPCGSPTVANVGRPLAMSASTSTRYASMPSTAAERMRASMGRTVGGKTRKRVRKGTRAGAFCCAPARGVAARSALAPGREPLQHLLGHFLHPLFHPRLLVDDALDVTLPPPTPDDLPRLRVGHVQHQRPFLILDGRRLGAIARLGVHAVHVHLLLDRRVVVEHQVGIPRHPPIPLGRQLALHRGADLGVEERIVVQPGIAGRQGVPGTPVVGLIPREICGGVYVRADAQGGGRGDRGAQSDEWEWSGHAGLLF